MHQNKNKPSKKQAKRQKQKRKLLQKQTHKISAVEDSSSSNNPDIDFNAVQELKEDIVQVSFIVAQIKDEYYHSLKTILVRYAQITKINHSQIADAILHNKKIGNVILADDQESSSDEDEKGQDQKEEAEDDQQNVYFVLTIFSGKNKITKTIKTILSKTLDNKTNQNILKIVNHENTGVLINQRLSNLPPFVVNSAHQVFKKDLLQLRKQQKKLYEEYCTGYLLNISEIQYEGSSELQNLIFSKFQDFEMCKRAELWWLGQRNQSYKKKADMRNLYYLISVQEYLKGVDLIKTYLEE